MMLIDAFSSSEAVGMGMSITTAAGASSTGKFQLSDKTRLFDEQLRLLDAQPGTKGLVGVGGPQPVGYYKDPEKSARTFVETAHGRFSVPGDWAVVNDDGVTLTLLGRGSVCINTGGEKVFPEEVEEVVKRYPGVHDCVVVGVPDEKWGEAITAVVSTNGGTARRRGAEATSSRSTSPATRRRSTSCSSTRSTARRRARPTSSAPGRWRWRRSGLAG